MRTLWPEGFSRIPDEDWAKEPLEELALKYDSVENHGWYENLGPTEVELAATLEDGAIVMDYSGGTGILADRLLRRIGARRIGIIIVDSSPKFLRLACEKLGKDERMAFRLIRYLKYKKRLQLVEETVDASLLRRGLDGVVSTNAIHLYYDLAETLRSWCGTLKPGGRALIQSGNIGNPDAPKGATIIDETVESVQEIAIGLVKAQARFAAFREGIDDAVRMASYAALRKKYFLPVRPLSHYVAALESAGFAEVTTSARAITARVRDWYEFLAAYHEGVLGWAGGAEKLEGRSPAPATVELRLSLLETALSRLFEDRPEFQAAWTYLSARRC